MIMQFASLVYNSLFNSFIVTYVICLPTFQVDILVHLIKVCALQGEFVTVLTPYSAQVECIKRNLTLERASQKCKRDYHTASMLGLVRVQTINDSQGIAHRKQHQLTCVACISIIIRI